MHGGGQVDAATAVDQSRFERLFREHSDTIYRFCLRRARDAELADDARSAVFFEAWRRRHEVDLADRSALPWLYGVAVNVLRNQRRSLRRRDAVLSRIPVPLDDFESTADVEERL